MRSVAMGGELKKISPDNKNIVSRYQSATVIIILSLL
jgi:hypothetical protein